MLIAAPSGHAASTASPLYSTFLTRVMVDSSFNLNPLVSSIWAYDRSRQKKGRTSSGNCSGHQSKQASSTGSEWRDRQEYVWVCGWWWCYTKNWRAWHNWIRRACSASGAARTLGKAAASPSSPVEQALVARVANSAGWTCCCTALSSLMSPAND